MAKLFLHLVIDHQGIDARCLEQRQTKTIIKDRHWVEFDQSDGVFDISDQIIPALDDILDAIDTMGCAQAIVLVSDVLVSFRQLILPFESSKKIRQVLDFELEPFLTLPEGSYLSDFHPLEIPEKSGHVFCACLDEIIVESLYTRLADESIEPVLIAPMGEVVTCGILKKNKTLSHAAILQVSQSEISLSLIHNRVMSSARAVVKKTMSYDQLALFIHQSVTRFLQDTGIEATFDFLVCFDPDLKDSAPVDTGPVGTNPADANMIYQAIETYPEFSTPMIKTPHSVMDLESLLLDIPTEKTITGMFNFCRGKYGSKSFFQANFKKVCVSIILTVMVLGMMGFNAHLTSVDLEKKIAMIDDRARQVFFDTFPDRKKVDDPYRDMLANVKHAQKEAGKNKSQGPKNSIVSKPAIEVISELSSRIGSSTTVTITRLLFKQDSIVLSGSTQNFNHVDLIKKMIESSDMFLKVTITSAVTDKKQDQIKFKFHIQM